MNNSDLIVATLRRAGIKRGFGVPSGNVLPLIEAMRKGGLDFVLTAHEGSAGFAADVTARLTGAPGLAIATLGPGATNLATGVGDAFLDRSPMIAITCNLKTPQLGRRIQMWIDHHQLFKPITKGTFALREGHVAETLKMAIELALTEPQGPVHLDLPEDVSLAPATEEVPELATPTRLPAPSDAAISEAHRILTTASRPIAVIGSSAMRMAKPELLKDFVERYQIPFATTTMAKGLIDEDHPLSIGCIERGRRQIQREFLHKSDLIVGLGYDTIEVEYEAWIGSIPLLQIDIEPVDTDETVKTVHQVTGNLDLSIAKLASLKAGSPSWNVADIAAHRQKFQAALRPAVSELTPHQVIDIARELLPKDGILAFDVGAHTHQIASQWQAHGPRQFLITNGWSSMGFGLPAAIAAKLAEPDKAVLCLIGDGCFQMTCGELTVAERQSLKLPVIVLNDGWLSLIRVKQMRRQFPYYGVGLAQRSYEEPPAHYFGVPAVGVRNDDELRRALRDALNADGPTVIEAFVNADHYDDTIFD